MSLPTIELRNYQVDIVNKLGRAFVDGKKCVVVVSGTGTGKTVMFSFVTQGAAKKHNVILLAAHRKEIIHQISMSLARFGVPHQVVASASKMSEIKIAQIQSFGKSFIDKNSLVIVGSVQTIVNRLDRINAVVVSARKAKDNAKLILIMDEGHHVIKGTQHGSILEYCERLGCMSALFTATPKRLDGKGLGIGWGGYADHMIEAPQIKWFIESGFLSPYKIFTVKEKVDLTGIHKVAGEYVSSELEEVMNKPCITGDAIEHYKREAMGLKAVVFCVSVKASQDTAQAFIDAGIRAAHIDGTTESAIRSKLIIAFADGELDVITQVNLFSEGFDLGSIAQKDVTIDCLIDLAPTNSLINAMQRWGRVLRPRAGKIAIILDHAGNAGERHGTPTTVRKWSLEGEVKGSGKAGEKLILSKECPKCFSVHDPAPSCPNCGFVYVSMGRKLDTNDGDLVEIDDAKFNELLERKNRRKEQGRAKEMDELIRLALVRGNKPDNAFHIFMARPGSTIQQVKIGVEKVLADFHAEYKEAGEDLKQEIFERIKLIRKSFIWRLKERGLTIEESGE